MIFSHGGVKIKKIAPDLVVKYGDAVQMNEARALQFVAKNTSIPVLHIFAVYTHGPFEDRDEEWSSKYDTYIFMKFVDGETADKEWERLDHISKDCVMGELQGYLEQLRNIPSAGYIESLENGPSIDSMFEYLPNKGTSPLFLEPLTSI